VEYNAMLKQKLEKDLAAVAMWRVQPFSPPPSSTRELTEIGNASYCLHRMFIGI
jgi:hypothetical protein